MFQVEYIERIDGGKLPERTSRAIAAVFRRLEGRYARIVITESKRKRTLGQNGLYKGIIIPMFIDFAASHGTTLSHEQADLILKDGVDFVEEVKLPDGRIKRIPKSTAKQDTEAMSEFTEKVIAYLAIVWGLVIPPNPGSSAGTKKAEGQ